MQFVKVEGNRYINVDLIDEMHVAKLDDENDLKPFFINVIGNAEYDCNGDILNADSIDDDSIVEWAIGWFATEAEAQKYLEELISKL